MNANRKKPIAVKVGNLVVKIYRVQTHGRDSYQVADYSSGKRKLISLSDEQEARLRATEIATKLARGEGEALSLTSKDRTAYVRAMELLKSSGSPVDVAALHYAEAVKVLGSDLVMEAAKFYAQQRMTKIVSKSVTEVHEELIEDAQARNLSSAYVADLRYRCGSFSRALEMPITSLRADDIRQYLAHLKLSARSHNNFVGAINRLLQFAEERNYLPADQDLMKGIRLVKDVGGEIEVFTVSELERLLAVASDEMLPVFAIGAFAGLRTSEIERLDWSEVNLTQRFIKVIAGKGKTGSRRIVPILENLASWLASHAKPSGKVWPHGHPYLYELMQKTAAATGTRNTIAVKWKHNGLRHSFISHRVAATQNVNQVALESGNSPQMIFAHYRELVTPAEAAAWFSIASRSEHANGATDSSARPLEAQPSRLT